jgi:hypothetical protein
MAMGRARLAMAQGVSVWVLEAPGGFGDAQLHAHHAIQITVCLSGALALTSGDRTIRAPAIAVAADAPHRFEAHGLLVFLFVEPESRAGRALQGTLFADGALAEPDSGPLREMLAPLAATFDKGLGVATLLQAGQAAIDLLAPAGRCCCPIRAFSA